MKLPPASTYRSRIANEAASSVVVPKGMAPRLSTLTSRRVFGSVPIVRYFMGFLSSRPVRALSTSLDSGARSRSNPVGRGSRRPGIRCCKQPRSGHPLSGQRLGRHPAVVSVRPSS
jgi:hypothetical protein